ncbi:sulfotransferase domain-containing protein [Thalassorhabdomicrobium marinisediminis]|uniref:Sulfotransferase domain-containing protein n=1 Tax=Thalassorhabdomicrobium marinisediminis TaxID=2170577 RepID=A0A2T7FSS2_9RHOB|nr:sulfotransferase domain-containing protein [Thalassorhabdomicrobium marinisediminis]PVA05193.1 hypothetical protein DC363_16500 [Thalassorhabdomicrobium marinisediminis]
MPKPNLIIAGCQKSGTTWLHSCLRKSTHIFGSKIKELNFFNSVDFEKNSESYLGHFPPTEGAQYYMESTPHYFQLPSGRIDTARNIESYLDDPKIIVIFRNPVSRYESAYVHHIMKGRITYRSIIKEFSDENKMLTLGRYAEVLRYWRTIFPDLLVLFHDDLDRDPESLVQNVMNYLNLDNDIEPDDLLFRSNDKIIKADKLDLNWPRMPKLSNDLRKRLVDYYQDDIEELETLTGRDLKHWTK